MPTSEPPRVAGAAIPGHRRTLRRASKSPSGHREVDVRRIEAKPWPGTIAHRHPAKLGLVLPNPPRRTADPDGDVLRRHQPTRWLLEPLHDRIGQPVVVDV